MGWLPGCGGLLGCGVDLYAGGAFHLVSEMVGGTESGTARERYRDAHTMIANE